MSVTLVHPANAVGRNELPFGRDTGVVPSNSVSLDRGSVPKQEGKICGSPIAILLWPLLKQNFTAKFRHEALQDTNTRNIQH